LLEAKQDEPCPLFVRNRFAYPGVAYHWRRPNAIYNRHSTHAEAIEVTFDPKIMSYRTLLGL
jgi:peptide methionine sulfoxide reductase MsrA